MTDELSQHHLTFIFYFLGSFVLQGERIEKAMHGTVEGYRVEQRSVLRPVKRVLQKYISEYKSRWHVHENTYGVIIRV